jgi:hypothetical protein
MPGEKQLRVAAFTMAYNERVFLPIWRAYYGQELGDENLYLLDHGSDDGSTETFPTARKTIVPRGEFDEIERIAIVTSFFSSLLETYDYVIFSDTDEILITAPWLQLGLREFIAMRDQPALRANGLDLRQVLDLDGPMDLSRPILAQRTILQVNPRYSKTLIHSAVPSWRPGFHWCSVKKKPDPDLFLLHLKRMDYDISFQNQIRLNSVKWSARSIAANHGAHFRQEPPEFVQRHFRLSKKKIENHKENIPRLSEVDDTSLSEPNKLIYVPDEWVRRLPVALQFRPDF